MDQLVIDCIIIAIAANLTPSAKTLVNKNVNDVVPDLGNPNNIQKYTCIHAIRLYTDINVRDPCYLFNSDNLARSL